MARFHNLDATHLEKILSAPDFMEALRISMPMGRMLVAQYLENKDTELLATTAAGAIIVGMYNAYELGLKHGDMGTPIVINKPEWMI